jgi:hypothetical protein
MALEIGGGITIGGGVSVLVEAGGGGGIALGSFVDTFVDDKGTVSYGSQNALTSFGVVIYYDPNLFQSTLIRPIAGTYTGYTASGSGESAAFYVGGIQQTGIILTVGGITQTLLLNSPWLGQYSINGDPFLLVSKVGQTLAASMTFV